ncbi:MAG TPA: MBL fold metallo-hydrolase [Bdellovibrionota bacterium]|nr:MBL fold metallo-hydrolase [Bdellovibrionota bacterium]
MKKDPLLRFGFILLLLLPFFRFTAALACELGTQVTSETSLMASSHLVIEPHELMLVDAGLTKSDATKIADWVASKQGRTLKYIFITHAHPDHFLGLEVLHQRFPGAKIISTQGVVAAIKKEGPALVKKYKARLGAEGPTHLIVPKILAGDTLKLEGVDVKFMELTGGESSVSAAAYVPAVQALFPGDVVYNETHAPLTKTGIQPWLKNLERLSTFGPVRSVYAGHGPATNTAALDRMKAYLSDFEKAVETGNRDKALTMMKERYPKYQMLAFLEKESIPAFLAKKTK